MLKRYTFAFALVGLTVLGAGCSSASPVSLDKYKNQTEVPVAVAPQEQKQAEPPAAPPEQAAISDTPVSNTPTPPTAMQDSSPLKFPGVLPSAETQGKFIHLKTTKGDIWFELLPKEGPKAASNFVYLAARKFYDGLTFHRIVPGFVVQGGDPLGTGTGGPGYQFEDDVVSLPYNEGIVAMANAGPNTNGSQFFIMLENNPLPPSYSIFGRVVKGIDVVKKIVMGDKMTEVTIETSKP